MAFLPFASSSSSLSKMLPAHVINTKTSYSFIPIINTFHYYSCTPTIFQCTKASVSNSTHDDANNESTRRSSQFKPTIWHNDYVHSFSSKYTEKSYAHESKVLREEVRMMLHKMEDDPLHQLELIDILQRLGVAYHFDAQIKKILQNHFNNNIIVVDNNKLKGGKNMYATALEFRLLRQHGHHLSTEVFDGFQDEMGNFKSFLTEDIKGMLSLYEASFHLVEDETILEKARDFTTKHLKEYVNVMRTNNKDNDDEMSVLIKHALELPLHWRMQRWEAFWFINAYERMDNMIPTLLHFAKLDFNMLQAIHLEELKDTSTWWKRIGMTEKLSYGSDRLVEGFLWGLGLSFLPQHGNLRKVTTKIVGLITAIDDIYDVYGTLEELELFTQAIDRWDINAIDDLPYYMKICFLALFTFVDELAFDILKDKGHYIIPHLKKVWTDLCKAYMREAEWYYSGHTPSMQEYLENGWLSISVQVVIVHAYLTTDQNPIKKKDLDLFLQQYPNIFRLIGIIFRLADDLETSQDEMKMGSVPKGVECYMNEYGVSEEEAREGVKDIIYETWKKLNEEVGNSPFNESLTEIAVNLVRIAQWFYLHGDGFGTMKLTTEFHHYSFTPFLFLRVVLKIM